MENLNPATQYALLSTLAIPLSTQIQSGFFTNTLKSALSTLTLNAFQTEQLEHIQARIAEGAPLFDALKDSPIFDDNVRFILRAASQSYDSPALAMAVALDYLKNFARNEGKPACL
jgi:type II secretory pathway component PulF